ncbi:MAG: regulatory protein GemA [Eubacterium sp.]|nr:regulatory protein GemA [Eubacterium sp.]
MRKITAAQNRKIHMQAAQLGMDDDLLHEFVYMLTEKQHISSLTVTEAVKVIDSLEGKKSYAAGSHVTDRQKAYIFFLMKQNGWTDEEGKPDIRRLDGFVRKQYGIGCHQFMDRKTASNVIEFLKEMKDRQEKRGRKQKQA